MSAPLQKQAWEIVLKNSLKAVEIAQSARDEVNTDALVFGSVAPLEDCYEPELAPLSKVCEQEHGQMIHNLINAGVDLVLLETMCSAGELCAASIAAMENVPTIGH